METIISKASCNLQYDFTRISCMSAISATELIEIPGIKSIMIHSCISSNKGIASFYVQNSNLTITCDSQYVNGTSVGNRIILFPNPPLTK